MENSRLYFAVSFFALPAVPRAASPLILMLRNAECHFQEPLCELELFLGFAVYFFSRISYDPAIPITILFTKGRLAGSEQQ